MSEKRQRIASLRTFTLRLCACTNGIKLISPLRDATVAGGEVRDYVSVMRRHTHAVITYAHGLSAH